MKTNMNTKNYFSILLASALALCGNVVLAKGVSDPVKGELAKIFDCDNTATVVEVMTNESGETIGHRVILGQDYGPLAFSNNFGAVTIDLNGWTIKGTNGVNGTTTTAGGNGCAAIMVDGSFGAGADPTTICVTNAQTRTVAVPTDAGGFDTTVEGTEPYYSTTFVPGDYCVVDLTTGDVVETNDVQSADAFNTDEYKTTKMVFRYVPAGKFKANSATTSDGVSVLTANDMELSEYWIMVFPVTMAQYNLVMGLDETTSKQPVMVSWNDARGGAWNGTSGEPASETFVARLNEKVAGKCAGKFDLCTSFQWERAARAGTRTDYFFSDKTAEWTNTSGNYGLEISGNPAGSLKTYAWYYKIAGLKSTQAVGGKSPNPWGLYDVYGNAYEYSLDWYAPLTGSEGAVKDYGGPSSGTQHVIRGGNYSTSASNCSSVRISKTDPDQPAAIRLVRISNAGIVGGNGGDGNPEGKGSPAVAEATGAEVAVADPGGFVANGVDGALLKSKTQEELEKIFNVGGSPTTVEPMYDENGVLAGHKVILGKDYGPLAFSNDFGAVALDLNGWTIRGEDGENGSETTAGGNGGTAITVDGTCGAGAGTTAITITDAVTTVPTDAEGFDYTTDGVTFLPGDYCVVDLTTGVVTEMKNVQSAELFNTVEYKTTKMAFRYVPEGKFKAVCAAKCGEGSAGYQDLVTNNVELSAYWMAVFPVTEAQLNAVLGSGELTSLIPAGDSFNGTYLNWNRFRGGDWTGWDGTYANVPAPGEMTFVGMLNAKVAAAGYADKFDLCTSFQWERAARAGTRSDYFFSDKTVSEVGASDWDELKQYAWYVESDFSDFGGKGSAGTQNVGLLRPNAWGLYDIYGNAYAWCLDWKGSLAGAEIGKDYMCAVSGSQIMRGGAYSYGAGNASSVSRDSRDPGYGGSYYGYRLVRRGAGSASDRPATGTGAAIVGGKGGDGSPAGKGSEAIVDGSGAKVTVTDPAGLVKKGEDGELIMPPLGSSRNPWKVGPEGSDQPQAYTNGNDELVIEGAGQITMKPWLENGLKEAIGKIVIDNANLSIPSDAFEGVGAETPVDVKLPDGWSGDFPDEQGNWHGAKVTITEWPLTVRNVTFSQPGRGELVTVECDLTGSRPFVLCINFIDIIANRKLNTISIQGETYYENLGQRHVSFTWEPTGDLGESYLAEKVFAEVGVSPAQEASMSEKWTYVRIAPEEEQIEPFTCTNLEEARARISGFLGDVMGPWQIFRKVAPGRYPGRNGAVNTTMGYWIQANEFGGNKAMEWVGLPQSGRFYPICRTGSSYPLSYAFVRGTTDPLQPIAQNAFDNNLILRFNKYASVISNKLRGIGECGVEEFDLPTEAQWEIACRAGTTTKWAYGDTTPTAAQMVYGKAAVDPWSVSAPSDAGVEPVDYGTPNGWGIFNMHGNLAEYCRDVYSEEAPVCTDADKPVVQTTDALADRRVLRGGNCTSTADDCASSARASIYAGSDKEYPDENLLAGFRLALPMRPQLTAASAPGSFETRPPTPGSPRNPWKVGPEGSDLPQAYTNGNDGLVIEGAGSVEEKPWLDDPDGITEITIKDPDTELPEGAFEGMGSDDEKIKIVLPDNWTGDLPDENGNWYGAKAEVESWPYMVRNVKFQQRYPWNGLVDITADVYGPEDKVLLKVSASDGADALPVFSFEGGPNFTVELTNGLTQVKFVWNADKDMGYPPSRLTNVRVKVTQSPLEADVDSAVLVERGEPGVTLNENGVVVGAKCDGDGYLEIPVNAKGLAEGVLANAEIKVVNFLSYRTAINLHAWDKSGFSATDVPKVQVCGSVPAAFYRDNGSSYANIGTAIAYHWIAGIDKVRSVPLSKLEQSDESEVGRLDLRRPIIVEPGESDKITYSSTEWGGQPFGTAVDIRFGRYGEEPYPVVFGSLAGDGVKDFVYPEQTGRYEFHYDIEASKMANMYIPTRPLVLVAWYVGKDDPESVYAYDRGDGEIFIVGNGEMKDFDECGPWGTDITGVTIKEGVWCVGAKAFKGCTKMTHAELPESMKILGNGAFAGDTALETVRCDAWDPPHFVGDPFAGVTKEDVTVYVPGDVVGDYEDSGDWAPFWNQSKYEFDEFYFEVYSYEGVSRKVTVDGEVRYEGADYFDMWISYGSKVEVTATITDDSYLFDDGSTEKTFTWNFWNHEGRIEREIAPYGADWITLQRALAGTPLADSRGAVDYNNVDGTNVVMLLKDISTRTSYDRTLVVTNAAVLDLAGHVVYYGNGYDSVIGVGSLYWELVPAQQQQPQQRLAEKGLQEVGQVAWEEDVAYQEVRRYLPAWLNIVDTVGGGRITKSGGREREKKEEKKSIDDSEPRQKKTALTATALGEATAVGASRESHYDQAGGITILPESVCIMDGGVIAGCYGESAGGVYNMGTFVLTGGEIAGNVAEYASGCDGIVNLPGAELVITGGMVRDGIYNVEENRVPAQQQIAVLDDRVPAQQQIAVLDDEFAEQPAYVAPVVEISGGYFGTPMTLSRAWIVEGYEPIPNAEFAGYDKKVIQTPPEVAEARTNAWDAIEEAAGLPMTRSDEMDDLVDEAKEAIRDAYPVENIETVLAEYLAKVADQYAKDNPGVPQTLTATGTLDLRSERELGYGIDTVAGITYSDSTWGWNETPGAVTITQQNLETGKKMAVVENQWGASEGTAVRLVGQNTEETGLGHKLFHAVRGTVLESFVTFFFSGFERGKPSNPWDAGEPNVVVYIDPGDPDGEPPTGPTLVIEGEGELDPNGHDVAWNDRRAEITEIFVASGIVLKTSALAGYPNLQRIVFEDPNYRLPREAMSGYEYWDDEYGWCGVEMTWPSDGVYVEQFNDRRKVTAFYNEQGEHRDFLDDAWRYGYSPILFSTAPSDLISKFPAPSTIEPITDENGDLTGWKVTLENDKTGPVCLPDNLGFVVLDLNGHNITGRDGYYDVKSDERRHGSPAIQIESSGSEGGEPLVLEIIDSRPDETPDVVGGKGLDGAPAGNGAPAIRVDADAREGTKVIVGAVVTAKGGDAGTGLGYGEPAGEPAPGAIPEDRVETVEGGRIEDGDAAESGVTAWATCSLGATPPADWLMNMPQGVSYVGGAFWFWRRTEDGYATFDFNELPLALIASAGITSANIEFVPGEIEVDTITAPVNFSFRFVGSEGGMRRQEKKAVLEKEMGEKEDGKLPVVISGTTTLIAVSGKSIFELVGEYATESQQQGPVVVWENLTFTCREEHAADRWGGAIRMEGGAMEVLNCTFTDCFADDYGGAIFAFGLERDSSITGCRFERCFADGMYGYGGAIYASSKVVGHAETDARVRLTVGSSTFANNAAVNGGAICTMRDANVDDLINEQPIELVISQTGFMENAAEYDGGAIFAEGPVTVRGTSRGGTVPVVPDPLPVRPIIVGAVRPTSFYGNLAGGSGGAIAMDCVVGDWFVPAKLSIGESTQFERNIASNAYEYALGGAIAHLQPGGELEVFGAKFLDNEAIATGFNTGLAYALGGAVYADADATVSLEKTRFFGNWAASESAYAYGGAGAFATGIAKVTACSFDDNGVAAPEEYYGGALDFAETTALVKDSTFRGSNVEAVDAYAAELTFTNCVIVGNATLFGDEWSDVYATDSAVDVAWTAYGSYCGEGTSPAGFDDAANRNLPASTVDIYDPAEGAEPWLCPTGYVAAAAQGLVQDATDIDGVPYGSRFWGYSMGAYECHTMRDMNVGIVVTVDPEEYAWTGLPIEPHSPKVNVYDTIVGSNLVEGVDYTLTWADNINPTDRAVVTAIGTERDYIFTSFTNFWITAYYVDSYKDDETEPFMTEMYGELSHTNVAARIAPPEGYAYDPLTSMPTGAVRRYDGECPFLRHGQLTLVVHYYKDEGDDEVPDIYQKKMHLKVVNGWWNEELNGADKIYWVTLYGEDGKWSVDGTGKLGENPTNRAETVVLPAAGERPFTDFSASGNWWYLFDASDFTKIAAPAGLEVRSGSWPFVIFLYDRKNESAGGRGGRGGRGGTGGTTDALTDYKLRAGLRISRFSYEDGKAAGEAWASVVDETTGQTLLDELLRRTKIDVLATPSLDKGEWSVIGSSTTDGEGGWGVDERPAAETPAQMFFKLRLR